MPARSRLLQASFQMFLFCLCFVLLIGWLTVKYLQYTAIGMVEWKSAMILALCNSHPFNVHNTTVASLRRYSSGIGFRYDPDMDRRLKGTVDTYTDSSHEPRRVLVYKPRLSCPAPPTSSAPPIIVFFHGGGWINGNVESTDGFCHDLCEVTQSLVFSVDYRLAPEYPFPTGLEDAYAALEWVSKEGSEKYNGNPGQLVVGGDSAGGNLAAVVALMARDRNGPSIMLQLLLYPITNVSSFETWSHKKFDHGFLLTRNLLRLARNKYLPQKQLRTHPYVSPLLAKSLEGLPDAFVIVPQFDPLRSEGVQYARRLSEAGARVRVDIVKGTIHGFMSFSFLRQRQTALKNIANVIQSYAGRKSQSLVVDTAEQTEQTSLSNSLRGIKNVYESLAPRSGAVNG